MSRVSGVVLTCGESFLSALEKSDLESFHRKTRYGPVAVKVCGKAIWDLRCLVPAQSDDQLKQNFQWVLLDSAEGVEILRHTMAHTLAQSVKALFPQLHCGLGPVIADGFFYEFSTLHTISLDDLPRIQSQMQAYINQNLAIVRHIWSKKQAEDFWQTNPLKTKILKDLPDQVTVYQQDDYWDLCRGPHLPTLGWLQPYFSLTKVAGSTWHKGPEVLQRIYGVAWANSKDEKAYQKRLQEAEKRDHRKLGQQLQLFHFQDEAKGSIFWHPKGWTVYRLLKNLIARCLEQQEYQEISTPQIVDRTLWEQSGHWDKFSQHMLICDVADRVHAIKPMNCPGHVQIFRQGNRSYRDLPLRLSEFGSCFRNEPSGSLMGLMRVRAFCQDDGHIFCTLPQLDGEVQTFCLLLQQFYKKLGFHEISVRFSDRPEQRLGDDATWDYTEKALQTGAKNAGMDCIYNPGDGAFYGPKLEFVLKDALGRQWQCGTLQVDCILPQRLQASYIGQDGKPHTPVMLHRAVLGSFERFIGILLEHYGGRLPWILSPIQMAVLTVSQQVDDYAHQVYCALKNQGIRVILDNRSEKIGAKIREYTHQKVLYLIIIGAKEAEDQSVTIRAVGQAEDGQTFSLENWLQWSQETQAKEENIEIC